MKKKAVLIALLVLLPATSPAQDTAYELAGLEAPAEICS